MEQLIEAPPEEKPHGLTKFITRVSRTMAGVGAISLFVMMAITVIDVGGRNIFLKPLNGSFELVGIMLVIAGTWGMGYCEVLKMNIRIGLFVDKLPAVGRTITWIITFLVAAVMAGMIAWQAFAKTADLATATLGNRTDTLGIPVWPFTAMMALGYAWACFIFFVELYKIFAGTAKK